MIRAARGALAPTPHDAIDRACAEAAGFARDLTEHHPEWVVQITVAPGSPPLLRLTPAGMEALWSDPTGLDALDYTLTVGGVRAICRYRDADGAACHVEAWLSDVPAWLSERIEADVRRGAL